MKYKNKFSNIILYYSIRKFCGFIILKPCSEKSECIMELKIEVFDDVMHVSRNRSFSLRMRFRDPKKAASLATFFFFSVFSPIFLHAEVVANQPTLLWSWLICMLPFFHTMLHWMSTTESNRDWMQITGLSMERLLILLIFKAVFWKYAKKSSFLQMCFLEDHLVTLLTRFYLLLWC